MLADMITDRLERDDKLVADGIFGNTQALCRLLTAKPFIFQQLKDTSALGRQLLHGLVYEIVQLTAVQGFIGSADMYRLYLTCRRQHFGFQPLPSQLRQR